MKRTTTHGPRNREMIAGVGLLALLIPVNALAQGGSIDRSGSPASLAFARYIASVHECNPFTASGPVAVVIEASLPGLYKQSGLLAIRQTGESERGKYGVLQIEGDATVTQEVIAPYLAAQNQEEDLPLSSVAITPANYKFRYMGEVGTGVASAYVFRIVPKKKRDGLIQGQLWIDSVSGVAVLQAGRFVRPPSFVMGRMELVRDTRLLDGHPSVRITHVAIATRLGRAELTITEYPLAAGQEKAPSQISPARRALNIETGLIVPEYRPAR